MDPVVRDARLGPSREHDSLSDVAVAGRRISAVVPSGTLRPDGSERRELHAEGRLLSLPLVDPHIHLDAVFTVGEPQFNESGALIEGIQTWAECKRTLSHDDVKRRARQAVLFAHARLINAITLARCRPREHVEAA